MINLSSSQGLAFNNYSNNFIISVFIDVIFIFILRAINALANTYYDFLLVW